MILEPIKPQILSVRVITQLDSQLAKALELDEKYTSIGMITCSIDDSLYAALDHGTKMADVEVVYAKSFYAGSDHASGPFSGEIIGIYASHDPDEVASALKSAVDYLNDKAWFYSADEHNQLIFFPHVIPSVGDYLAKQAGVNKGTAMAYLIAPPIEAQLALDAALKVADVEMKVYYDPPSETNFSGGLLVGDLPAVEAAAKAFSETVLELAQNPTSISPNQRLEELTERLARNKPQVPRSSLPYRIFESGMELDEKPAGYTHLFDNQSLVHKSHGVIKFRGKLDLLHAHSLDASVRAIDDGRQDISQDLEGILVYIRNIMGAEVTGRPMPNLEVGGFTDDELHKISHNTAKYLNVGWVLPEPGLGKTVSALNLARALTRDLEIMAHEVFTDDSHMTQSNRQALFHGLNRLSNIFYVLVCKVVGTTKQ